METVLEGEEMIKHVILLLISEVLFHLEENNMFHNLPALPMISCTCQTSSNTCLVFPIILLVLLIPFIKLGPPIHMQLLTTTPKVWNYASKKLRAWCRHFDGQQSNPLATAHIAHVRRFNFLPMTMLSAKGLVKHQTRCHPKQFHWARMVVLQWYGCTLENDHNANF